MYNKLLLVLLIFSSSVVLAQDGVDVGNKGYIFKNDKEIDATSVKNQYRSGTCWSFSSISFIESELLRLGKGEFDLSEMYVVRCAYIDKAERYVRMHGNFNFSGGGACNDALDVIDNYGMLPEQVYSGLNIGEKNHIHGEMDEVLKDYLDGIIKNKNKKLSPVWLEGFKGILDAYLGKVPEKFKYNGKTYTAKTFANDAMGLNTDEYVLLSSFTHHPFYNTFIIEVPDNWSWASVYNVPLNDLESVIDNSINNGYTIGWAADVSEKGFSWKNGLAIVPDKDIAEMSDLERDKWEKLSSRDKEKLLYTFDKPGKEKNITQELRQESFDNYLTTDDHGLHITGIGLDQAGTKYYYVKNSWGIGSHKYKGYLYVSKPFMRYKTMSIIVNKKSIPKDIAKKLGL